MKGLKIARIFGIDIEIHISWLVIFLLVVWLFAGNYLPKAVPGQAPIFYWLFGVATALVFFASALCHELAHSLTAKRFKMIIKRITLFVFGGIAQMEEGAKSAKAEFLMAAAGPLSSLVLAGLFWGLMQAGANVLPRLATAGFYYLAMLNAMLAVFNLIPGFPLDGGRMARAILWGLWKDELKATKIASYGGRVFGILLILYGVFLFVFSNDFFSLLWLGLIGWFIFRAAKGGYQQLIVFKALAEVRVKEVMEKRDGSKPGILNPEIICHPEDSLKTVYDRMTKMREQKSEFHFVEFDVIENGEIVGRITPGMISRFVKKKMGRGLDRT